MSFECIINNWYILPRNGHLKLLVLQWPFVKVPMDCTFNIRVNRTVVFKIPIYVLLSRCTCTKHGQFILPDDLFLIDGNLPVCDLTFHECQFAIMGENEVTTYRLSFETIEPQNNQEIGGLGGLELGFVEIGGYAPTVQEPYEDYACHFYSKALISCPSLFVRLKRIYMLELPLGVNSTLKTYIKSLPWLRRDLYWSDFSDHMRAFSESVPQLPWELVELIFSYLHGIYIIDIPDAHTLEDPFCPVSFDLPSGTKAVWEYTSIFRVGSGLGYLLLPF
jgi:hypothetical protein